jgi:hypothetical protein
MIKMHSGKPFSFWLKNGASATELMRFYALSEKQYERVISCLGNIKKSTNKRW